MRIEGDAAAAAGVELTAVDFAAFFAANNDRVARALALTLGDAEAGREAAAEGMARAFQRWERIARYEDPTGWVYRVGLNWSRTRFRRTRREVLVAASPVEEADAERPHADPRLAAALAGLTVEQRSVVVLRFFLDWSEARTAAALGIAPGTAKSRCSRALERLAVLLADTPTDRPQERPDGPR